MDVFFKISSSICIFIWVGTYINFFVQVHPEVRNLLLKKGIFISVIESSSTSQSGEATKNRRSKFTNSPASST